MKSPREVIQEWVTAFNSRDAARAAARYHEDATNWQVAAGEPTVSRSRIVVDGKIKYQRGYWDKVTWLQPLGIPV